MQYGDDRTYLQNFAMSRAQQCHIPRRLRSHAVGREAERDEKVGVRELAQQAAPH